MPIFDTKLEIKCQSIVKLEKHLNDLIKSGKYEYKEEEANAPIHFIEQHIQHWKAPFDGKPLLLEEHQKMLIRAIFGIYYKDEDRRLIRDVFYFIPRKNGKALDIETEIPTPNGFVKMGDLKEGDKVFGADGKPCNVTFATDVMHDRNCYKLSFSDGSSVVADEEHLWSVYDRVHNRNGGRKELLTLTTGELIKNGLNIERTDDANERRYSLPINGPVEFKEKDLLIHPYVLGLWLGDGACSGNSFSCWDKDYYEYQEILKDFGYSLCHKRTKENTYSCRIVGDTDRFGSSTQNFLPYLRRIGVLNNKHIPEAYLTASLKQRRLLLAGIIDTDGTVSKKGDVTIGSVFERFGKDILELVRSIGYKASLKVKRARLYGKDCGPYYQIQFRSRDKELCFIKRKKERLLATKGFTRSTTKQILSIEEVSSVPVRCIQVDSENSLYLAGRDYTVTHNTSLLAAILCYIFFMEGKGLEIYIGASKLKQSKIAYNDICKFIEASKTMSKFADVWKDRIEFRQANSVIKPLAAEGKTGSGLNCQACLLDEIHEMRDHSLIDVIKTSMSARKNPLNLMATTAGASKYGPAWDMYEYAKGVLNKTTKDDTFLPVIFEVDEGVDYQSELAIKMANPNLNISTKMDEILVHKNAADQTKYKQANYHRMYLNRWVSIEGERWFQEDQWAEFHAPDFNFHEKFAGKPIYCGLDIGPKVDMTALASVAEENGNLFCHVDYFIPEEQVRVRVEEDKIPYDRWVEEGHLNVTPGNTIDSSSIIAFILEHASKYQIQHLGFDPAFSFDIFPHLEAEKIEISQVKQNVDTLTYPCNYLEKKYLDKTIVHEGCPILSWNAKNAKIFITFDGRKKITKDYKSSKNRVDGLSAILCAIEAMRRAQLETEDKAKDMADYTDEDIRSLTSIRQQLGF